MTVEYSNQSLHDIREMAARSKREFGDATAAKLQAHLRSMARPCAGFSTHAVGLAGEDDTRNAVED